MRTSSAKLNPSLHNQLVKTFSQLIVDLKNAEEVEIFLKDFFKESELDTFIKRISVAYWLKKGRSYTNIKNNLKVSSATIASVQSSLGSPGISLAIKKMEADEWANQWSEKIKQLVNK